MVVKVYKKAEAYSVNSNSDLGRFASLPSGIYIYQLRIQTADGNVDYNWERKDELAEITTYSVSSTNKINKYVLGILFFAAK